MVEEYLEVSMSAVMSRPVLRWAVPLSAAGVVLGVGVAASALRSAADPTLPERSAAQLLVDVQTASLDGLSGTVVQSADLGLPALPGAAGSPALTSLISGSHTLRVWYSGPDKVRLALLGKVGETDVIRNGRDVWVWSSDKQTAQHRTLPENFAGGHDPTSMLPATPQEAADRVLSVLEPSTVVTTDGTARVAGRAAYELVLAPRDAASLVSSVRLAVDGEKRVPLRVQVFAKSSAAPAFEVGFQQISFDRPGDEHFRFTPPPGTTVEEGGKVEGKPGTERHAKPGTERDAKPDPKSAAAPAGTKPKVEGSGWTTVLVMQLPSGQVAGEDNQLGGILNALPRVSGDWGSGRLLRSKLVTALLTDDGRVLVGAVTPERLYAVAK